MKYVLCSQCSLTINELTKTQSLYICAQITLSLCLVYLAFGHFLK